MQFGEQPLLRTQCAVGAFLLEPRHGLLLPLPAHGMRRKLLRASTSRMRRVDVILIQIRHNVFVLKDFVIAGGASVLGDSFVCAVTAKE